jgi:hypothetical protein
MVDERFFPGNKEIRYSSKFIVYPKLHWLGHNLPYGDGSDVF